MKTLLIVCFVWSCSIVSGQSGNSISNVRSQLCKVDSTYTLQLRKPGKATYDFFQDSLDPIYELTAEAISTLGKNKKSPIVRSHVLNELARLSYENIRSIATSKRKTRNRISKRLKRIFLGTACSFKLINYIAFDIDLVNTKGNFYYDKNGIGGGFNLYKGKGKISPTEDNPEPEQTPVDLFTEKELSRQINKKLNTWGISGRLRNKEITAVGIYIAPRTKTFYKTKTPQARVVIIFGMKRFGLILKDRKWRKKYSSNTK